MAPTLPRFSSSKPAPPVIIDLTSSSSSDDGGHTNSNSSPAVPTSSSVGSGEVQVPRMRRKSQSPCYGHWTFHDERLILRTLADSRRRHGELPRTSVLHRAIRASFMRQNATSADVSKKISNLRNRHWDVIRSGAPVATRRDQELYDLCEEIWPEMRRALL